MEDSELIVAVRAQCGKVTNDEELGDADVLREGSWILRRIDERITDRRKRSFIGVKDESEYDPDDNTVRVQKVFPYGTLESDSSMVLGSHHSVEDDPDVSEEYLFPSLYVIRMQRKIRGLPKLKWEWNHIRRKIIIDPAPTQAGDKYWYISIERVNWTIDNLPVDFEELLVIGASWRCIEIVLLKRSDLGGIERSGGFIDYPASALKGFIDSKRDDFYNTLKLKVQLYGVK